MLRLFALLLLIPAVMGAETRYHKLPGGFKWRYVMNEPEPLPRKGLFWRSAIFLDDKIIALNNHTLIALTYNGVELWKMGLQVEYSNSEAKIHKSGDDEIIVVITDAVLRIDSSNGQLIDHYGYDSGRMSAFQMTELLPRTSVLMGDYVYVFLGPVLIAFHKETLDRHEVQNFNSSPKTIPVVYDEDYLVTAFVNGYVHMINPATKERKTLLANKTDVSIRQIVADEQFIYIPTSGAMMVYSNNVLYAESDMFPNNILSKADGKIWLQRHKIGEFHQIDQTLSPVRSITYTDNKTANNISSPIVGSGDTIIYVDSNEGKIYVMDKILRKIIFSEDFMDNPPVQFLNQKDSMVLLGGFEGLYLIDINELRQNP